MPVPMLKGIATKAGTTLERAEKIWNESKPLAAKKFKEGDPKYYPYLVGIVERRLGLHEAMFREGHHDPINPGKSEEAEMEVTAKRVNKWSQDVTDGGDFHTKEGIFQQSSDKIATYLLKQGKGKAMSRLNFYINRAGKNLSVSDRNRLEKAKRKIERATETANTADYVPQYRTAADLSRNLKISHEFWKKVFPAHFFPDGCLDFLSTGQEPAVPETARADGTDPDRMSEPFLQSNPDTDPIWGDDQTGAVTANLVHRFHNYLIQHRSNRAHRSRGRLLKAFAQHTGFKGTLVHKGEVTPSFRDHLRKYASPDLAQVARAFHYHNIHAAAHGHGKYNSIVANLDSDWNCRVRELDRHHEEREAVGHGLDSEEAWRNCDIQRSLADSSTTSEMRDYHNELADRYEWIARYQDGKVAKHIRNAVNNN